MGVQASLLDPKLLSKEPKHRHVSLTFQFCALMGYFTEFLLSSHLPFPHRISRAVQRKMCAASIARHFSFISRPRNLISLLMQCLQVPVAAGHEASAALADMEQAHYLNSACAQSPALQFVLMLRRSSICCRNV